jgi:hypothetical protein
MKSDYTPDDLLPLSGIQRFLFCRRQWALIHVEQQWKENAPSGLFVVELEAQRSVRRPDGRGHCS